MSVKRRPLANVYDWNVAHDLANVYDLNQGGKKRGNAAHDLAKVYVARGLENFAQIAEGVVANPGTPDMKFNWEDRHWLPRSNRMRLKRRPLANVYDWNQGGKKRGNAAHDLANFAGIAEGMVGNSGNPDVSAVATSGNVLARSSVPPFSTTPSGTSAKAHPL